MRLHLFFLFICCAFGSPFLYAQDVETQYQKIQENYSLRVEDILQRTQRSQREQLHTFILSLVRSEQDFREEGDLEGVMFCRELRERLLVNPEALNEITDAPEAVEELLQVMRENQVENNQRYQQELNQLNLMLYNILEAYQKEFTRQSMLEKALEVFNLRKVLAESLERSLAGLGDPESTPLPLSVDPNQYPLAFEGDIYKPAKGITPRTSRIDLHPTLEGDVEETPFGYTFLNGRITLPATATRALIEDLSRNQMFSLEIGFQPDFDFQGFPKTPVVLFQLGESPDTALASLTLEGRNIIFRFKTDAPPPGKENHQITVGQLQTDTPSHVGITYRNEEFSVFFNGERTIHLRNQITGSLTNWEEVPVILGYALPDPESEFSLPYRGDVHHFYIKVGDTTSRQAASNYSRFLKIFE